MHCRIRVDICPPPFCRLCVGRCRQDLVGTRIFTARTIAQHSEQPSPRASQRPQCGILACTTASTCLPATAAQDLAPTAAPGTKISHPHAIALPAAPIPYTMHPSSLKTVEKSPRFGPRFGPKSSPRTKKHASPCNSFAFCPYSLHNAPKQPQYG